MLRISRAECEEICNGNTGGASDWKEDGGECIRWLNMAVLAVGGLLTGTGVLNLHNSLKGPELAAGVVKNR